MTRKDYVAIAKVLAVHSDNEKSGIPKKVLVKQLSEVFRYDNNRFQPVRFEEACQWTDWRDSIRGQKSTTA